MALTDAADQVRSEFASGILHRHRSFVLRPCRDRAKPELALGSDFCRRRGCTVDDDGRILLDLVQTAGSHASFTRPTWRRRVTSSMALLWPAMLAAFLASLVEAVGTLTITPPGPPGRGGGPAPRGAVTRAVWVGFIL